MRNLESRIGQWLLGRGTRDLDVKRIQQKQSAAYEVVGDARHNSEVVEQGYGNDKFVDEVVVIGHSHSVAPKAEQYRHQGPAHKGTNMEQLNQLLLQK